MARNFNGGTDQVRYATAFSAFSTGCLSFWVKTTQSTANVALVSNWSFNNSINGLGVLMNNTANKATMFAKTPTTALQQASSASINTGSWVHVAVNFDVGNGNPNEIFIDGNSSGSQNSLVAWTCNDKLYIGDNADTFWPTPVADICEVAWWTRKLDAAEIAALAKGFSPKLIARDNLCCYTPLVRETRELAGEIGADTVTGTTVTDHPRIIGGMI